MGFSGLRKSTKALVSYAKRRPLICTWQPTYRCNLRCTFCGYWDFRQDKSRELTTEQFETAGANLAQIGTMIVNIAGGEPFVRPDLPDIVSILARDHFVTLTSNGWFATPEKARAIFGAGAMGISISIDSMKSETHDTLRGMPGTWERAVRALHIFSEERTKKGQFVNLMCVLSRDNLDEMEPLIQLAQEAGASFMVQPYCDIKIGATSEMNHEDLPSARLMELKRRYSNFTSSDAFLRRFDDYALAGGLSGCTAGRSLLNIDESGDVAKCVEAIFEPVGNILSTPPEELLRRLHHAQATNTCDKCWYNCRGEYELIYRREGLGRTLAGWAQQAVTGGRNGRDGPSNGDAPATHPKSEPRPATLLPMSS
jgi:MoaA/NifB/PqqE/SkfB family radical SAM enzyme